MYKHVFQSQLKSSEMAPLFHNTLDSPLELVSDNVSRLGNYLKAGCLKWDWHFNNQHLVLINTLLVAKPSPFSLSG